jgi:pentatricopeptide repeat protein
VEPGTRRRWSVDARWLATRRTRKRSCGGKLLHEMQEHGGIDPDKYTYATVISGWCKTGRIEDAARVFDEMLAAGEVKPTAVMYNALIGGRRGEGNGRRDPNAGRPRPSRRQRSGYGTASRKERRRSECGDRVRRARRSHGAARHGELPSPMRRSGWNWTGTFTSASGSVLPVAGSAQFHRRVRVQGNRPRASRLKG